MKVIFLPFIIVFPLLYTLQATIKETLNFYSLAIVIFVDLIAGLISTILVTLFARAD